ncbi:MAG: hypothetical protein K0Q73_5027 [Paenibacillus sp.]|nr:hypothetical protein [Paenibacillus sp.]
MYNFIHIFDLTYIQVLTLVNKVFTGYPHKHVDIVTLVPNLGTCYYRENLEMKLGDLE